MIIHYELNSQHDTITNGFKIKIENYKNVNNNYQPLIHSFHFYKFNPLNRLNTIKNNSFSTNSKSIFATNVIKTTPKSFNNLNFQQKQNLPSVLNIILKEYLDSEQPYFSKTEEFNRNYMNERSLYTNKNGYFLSASGTDSRYINTNGYYYDDNDLFFIPWIFFLISDVKGNHDSKYGNGNK